MAEFMSRIFHRFPAKLWALSPFPTARATWSLSHPLASGLHFLCSVVTRGFAAACLGILVGQSSSSGQEDIPVVAQVMQDPTDCL